MKKLGQIPVPAAVAIMVLCILLGITFGNHNALEAAKAEPEAILQEVSALAAKRAGTAKNLLVVAGRNTVDAQNTKALSDAIAALEDARRADRIAEASRSVDFAAQAVNEQLQQTAGDQDKRLATGVMDDLYSTGAMMNRQGTIYNEALADVRSVYNKLPMRWLIGGMPEVYQ